MTVHARSEMASPITDQLAADVIRHKPGALKALIEHAKALEAAQNAETGTGTWISASNDAETANLAPSDTQE